MARLEWALYCISTGNLQVTKSFPCIVCVFRHRLLLFAFYHLLWLTDSFSWNRRMLFAEIICNQRTRSLLGPHVSSINVAGEIKPWLMHGLFCLWETGCVCDFYLFFYFSVDAVRYSGTDMTEAVVDTHPDPDLKAFARTARLITLLNGNLMPLCPRVCALISNFFVQAVAIK